MDYYKKLVGNRIYLSPQKGNEEEIEKCTQWLNDFNVTDYVDKSSRLITYQDEVEYFENNLKKSDVNKHFSIIDLKTDKIVGVVGLNGINWVNRYASLGIFIGEAEYRNQGYGTEAIKMLLDYGFNYLNLHSIHLSLLDVNERAHKCYLKCGFKDSGIDRDRVFVNGKYYNLIRMDILSDEFVGDFIKNKNI